MTSVAASDVHGQKDDQNVFNFNDPRASEALLKKQTTPTVARFNWKRAASPPIGQGRYGTVYKVIKEEDGVETVLAAKVCSVEEVRTPSPSAGRSNSVVDKIVKPLRKEAEILSCLNHPNVVSFFGYERTFSHFTLFFELMSGGSLRQYINKVGALDEELSKRYMRQIVLAVTYLHDECDIVHRDIKAGNVLLNVNCTEIKLATLKARPRRDLSARTD